MSRKTTENKLIDSFSQKVLTDNVVLPYFLISDFHAMDINEKELVMLLRILHPFFKYGELNFPNIAKEFGVKEDEAKVIVQPYFDKLLLVKESDNSIAITGIINCYYEHWITTQRDKKRKPTAKKVSCSSSRTNQQLIKDLTHLFRIFEQELGRNLSPLQSEEIRNWLEKDKLPAEMIEEALKRAVMQEKRTFAYIKSILKKWRDAGYNDLASVMTNDVKPTHLRKTRSKTAKIAEPQSPKRNKYSQIYDKY